MKTLLVTGGAGFIGSHFIKYILKKYENYKIINLDKLTYCANLKNLKEVEANPNYSFVQGDITDSALVDDLAKKSDYIINFAAETHVDNSIKNPENFVKTNVYGAYVLLEAAKNNNIEKFLQISTDEVYGSIEVGKFSENSPLAPNSPYSASKASADMLARSYFKTYNLPILITRCSNNYGENQYNEKLIPHFINNLMNNKKIPLYSDGSNVRDWIYVLDHARALDIVLHEGKIGDIYNIGANEEKTNLEITKIILKQMVKSFDMVEFVEDRKGHDKRYAIDNSKIKSLGWKPEKSFNDGIIQTINWYVNNIDWIKKWKYY